MSEYRMSTRRKLAIASWDEPREGNIYGKLTVDATQALAYLDWLRQKTGEHVTITHLVGKAAGVALSKTPTLNGRIVGGRYLPFPTVDIAFLVALEDGQDLAKVKVTDVDKKPLNEICAALKERAGRLRGGKDPEFEKSKGAIRAMPMWLLRKMVWLTGYLAGGLGMTIKALGVEPFPFGSCIVTSVGMFGLDEGYVPPTPFARVPLYVLVGAVREQPKVENGALVVRPHLTITATIDHRFIDGAQLGVLAKVVRRYLEDPFLLDEAPAAPAAP